MKTYTIEAKKRPNEMKNQSTLIKADIKKINSYGAKIKVETFAKSA